MKISDLTPQQRTEVAIDFLNRFADEAFLTGNRELAGKAYDVLKVVRAFHRRITLPRTAPEQIILKNTESD